MKIKIKETKETEILAEEDFDECNNGCCIEEIYDTEDYCPTPLETGFRQWQERKKQCKSDTIAADNLTEELLYSCLQHGYKSCLQI